MDKRETALHKHPILIVIIGAVILSALVLLIIFVRGRRATSEHSITLTYEIDIARLSKSEIEDLANDYLIPTLQARVPGQDLHLRWHSNGKGIHILAVSDAQTIKKLKQLNRVVELELPAYLKIKNAADGQESAKNLKRLGQILTEYARRNNEKYPASLDELRPYDASNLSAWLLNNVEYLGKAKTLRDPPRTPIAYDRTQLRKDKGANTLFNDMLVTFVKLSELQKLGIAPR